MTSSQGNKVGVVTSPVGRAHWIRQHFGLDEYSDLGLIDCRTISARERSAGRGLCLDLMLIEDAALPLSRECWASLSPCLYARDGKAYVVRRFDPYKDVLL